MFFRLRHIKTPALALCAIAILSGESPAYTVFDATGAAFEFSEPPTVVSLTPSVSESVCQIGAEDKLLGVSVFCGYPASLAAADPKAEKIAAALNGKKRLGSFFSPKYEEILALKPDIVIMPNSVESSARNKLQRLGLKVFLLHPDGLDEISKNAKILGELFRLEKSAEAEIAAFNAKIPPKKPLPDGAPKAVFIFDNGYAAGAKSFAGELIERFGYKNIATQNMPMWFVPQGEFLLAKNPQVVFIAARDENEFSRIKASLLKKMPKNAESKKDFVFVALESVIIPSFRLAGANIPKANPQKTGDSKN
ncbi:MAG: ABC transporter substrate-binding protein [Opitutales bacterium]|nr:ABC transporter substrate-binding protein [Opitutales bacterium]